MKITEKRLRQIISEALREEAINEITRYEEEMGKDVDLAAELKKYISKSQPTRYAFTMTAIPKVGLNPGTNFNTPAGVYAYPLNLAYFRKLIDNTLPFQSSAPYCNIMKLNLNGKWLYTSAKGLDKSTQEDLEAAKAAVNPDVVRRAESYGSHYGLGIDSKIFDITFFATRDSKTTKPTVAWTALLRKLGYIGVYDPGNKVIHPSEPNQLVCLEPSAYEWVATFETKAIRKQNKSDTGFIKPQKFDSIKDLVMPDHLANMRAFIYKLSRLKRDEGADVKEWVGKVIDNVSPVDNGNKFSVIKLIFDYKEILGSDSKLVQKMWDALDAGFKSNAVALVIFLQPDVNAPAPVLIDIVNELSKTENLDLRAEEFRDALKKNNLPSESLAKIASVIPRLSFEKTKTEIYYAIAKHPNITPEILETLPAEARINSSKVAPEFISQVFKKHEKDIKKQIDVSGQQDLAISIAKNRNTPSDVLNKLWDLTSDKDKYTYDNVRQALASNPNIGKEKMQEIIDEFVPGGKPIKNYDVRRDKGLFVGLMMNPALPGGVRIRILKNMTAGQTYEFLRNKEAAEVFTSQFLDDFLSNVRDVEVKFEIMRHSNFSKKSLRRLTNDPDKKIANAARNLLKTGSIYP